MEQLPKQSLRDLLISINEESPDGIFLTGDIATGTTISSFLQLFNDICPIYLILGNHDMYHSSIAQVRKEIVDLHKDNTNLYYLPHTGPIKLNDHTVLAGVDGWYDAKCGYTDPPKLEMSDWRLIEEFKHIHPFRTKWGCAPFLSKIDYLAREEAEKARTELTRAILEGDNIIFLTHVPPWREASRDPKGNMSDDVWAPWFTNLTLGKVLEEIADQYPTKSFTVLCGHTHTTHTLQVSTNLVCRVGRAEYGKVFYEVIEIE